MKDKYDIIFKDFPNETATTATTTPTATVTTTPSTQTTTTIDHSRKRLLNNENNPTTPRNHIKKNSSSNWTDANSLIELQSLQVIDNDGPEKSLLLDSPSKKEPTTLEQDNVEPSPRSEERFSRNAETDLVCRLLLEKKK
eukprot:TRINITY_DN8297_c0_g1_i4.p1 TRINITY_DN8297_c0_g1~~TRINITY_DN8297_c0_g1_i4.p1  ORF type:complete len:140 (-),score=30.44 TRINITY_DN8297_c0_g1_i4:9-428(-)